MTQAIRFYSIDPRTGAEDTEYGHAWKTDEGLEYENDIVRDIMAVTVRRFGADTAFRRFSDWGNGYSCSHLVEDDGEDLDGVDRADLSPEDEEVIRAAGGETFRRYWTESAEGLAKWVNHPHPWTALRNHLQKHVGRLRANRIASQWFHRVFGIWPGERKGQNPVGPG